MKRRIKKELKELLCILLSVLTIVSTAPVASVIAVMCSKPVTANAQTSVSGDYEYTVISETNGEKAVALTEYNGTESTIITPSEIDGYKVVGLNGTFSGNKYVTSITVSEGVCFIGRNTFYSLSNSLSLKLPNTLEYIDGSSFKNTVIQNMNFPQGLLSVGTEAFTGAQFLNGDIVLPESLLYLPYNAFAYSNITSVYIPSNVRFVENVNYSYTDKISYTQFADETDTSSPFAYCNSLNAVTCSADNPYYTVADNVLYSKDMHMLWLCPNKNGADFEIRDSVTLLAYGAFNANSNVGNLVYGKNIEAVLPYEFEGASINSISFPANCKLKEIGEFAFYNSSLGGKITVPSSVETICESAFENSLITEIGFETPSSCSVIAKNAFHDCKQLKKVFIPNSLQILGTASGESADSRKNIFRNCKSLESVVFEDDSQLTYIDKNAFYNCFALREFDFGKNNGLVDFGCFIYGCNGIESLDFSECFDLEVVRMYGLPNLKTLDLRNTNLTEINCFNDCPSLEKVMLPDSLRILRQNAFKNCTSLQSINLSNVVQIDSGALTNTQIDVSLIDTTEKQYGDFLYRIIETGVIITGYTKDTSQQAADIIIPESIESKPVTEIGYAAFQEKNINTLLFPDTLKKIGDNAFYNARISNMPEFPGSLEHIGAMAFYNSLQCGGTLTVGSNVSSISNYCFFGCEINDVVIEDGVRNIGTRAFKNCINLESIIIPDSVISVGAEALYSATLKKVTFGANIVNIEQLISFPESDFVIDEYEDINRNYLAALEEINVSADNPYYTGKDGVLFNKDMTAILVYPISRPDKEYALPDTVKVIEGYCFAGSKYTQKVVLNHGLERISALAFYENSALQSISIPSSVTQIRTYAFSKCSALEAVEFEDGVKIDSLKNTFCECKALDTVIFAPDVEIDYIYNAFRSTAIKNIVFPNNIREITYFALADTPLESVVLPAGLKNIGAYAFSDTCISKLVIPSGVENIGENAFANCKNLVRIEQSGVSGISSKAFKNCTALENIDLTGVSSIAPDAFEGCVNLVKFYFVNENIENADISENSFIENETIETIVVGNSVTEIKDRAFADCTNLTTALIADSVTQIADTAFENCDNLNIVCEVGSYAVSYAKRNSIPYTTFVVAPIPDQEYTGKEITPELDVTAQSKALSAGSDYTAVYSDNIHVGTAKVNVIGLGDYSIFASLVKFNIVGDETQNTTPEETVPAPPQQNDEEEQGSVHENAESQTGSAADGNHPNGSANKKNTNTPAQPGTDDQSEVSSSAPADATGGVQQGNSQNSAEKGGNTPGQNGGNTVRENSAQNESAEDQDSAAEDNQTAPDQPNTDGSEDTDMKWYEVILSALRAFFQKIIAFFKSFFS